MCYRLRSIQTKSTQVAAILQKKKALSLNEWIQVPRSLAGQLSQRHLTGDNVEKSDIVKVWVIRETKGPSILFIGRKEVSSVLSDA